MSHFGAQHACTGGWQITDSFGLSAETNIAPTSVKHDGKGNDACTYGISRLANPGQNLRS